MTETLLVKLERLLERNDFMFGPVTPDDRGMLGRLARLLGDEQMGDWLLGRLARLRDDPQLEDWLLGLLARLIELRQYRDWLDAWKTSEPDDDDELPF